MSHYNLQLQVQEPILQLDLLLPPSKAIGYLLKYLIKVISYLKFYFFLRLI